MNRTILDEIDAERWDAFLLEMGGHLLQSHLWGEFKSRFGWEARRAALLQDGRIKAGAQILFRRLPLGTIAYVPRGPVVGEGEEADRLLRAVGDLARQEGAVFLRLEPDWEEGGEWVKALLEAGFHPTKERIQPRSTLIVDLHGEPEEMLGRMKPKWRYNIRLAQKKGLEVRGGEERDLALFYQLLRLTGKRDRFAVHSYDYYREAWNTFVPRGMARLFLAVYRGQVLAGLMAFAFGNRAYYLYGASGDEHRNLMPNHLLQWEAMMWAKGLGGHSYDLWGIPDEIDEDELGEGEGGLFGVYRFKRGFGGRLVRTVGAYDIVFSPFLYWALTKVLPRLRALYGGLREIG